MASPAHSAPHSATPSPAPTVAESRKEMPPGRRAPVSQQRHTGIPSTDGAPLSRVGSTNSAHAGTSLRRMATHETGELVEQDRDGALLDPHDEHDEHVELGLSDRTHTASPTRQPVDEGTSPQQPKEKKKFELQDQTNLLPIKQVLLIFMGLNCALFCSLLDQTIVTTALPTLGAVFQAQKEAPWVGTAYMLTSTALTPVYGRISDIWGRKIVLMGSLVIFLIGSLACAVAQTMIQLIIFRALQGLGGGGILTLSMIIISDVISLKERGKYQGIIGGTVACANSLGPILGGIFTEKASWRWCFWINLPLTGLAIFVVFFFLPLKKVEGSMWQKTKKLDYYGTFLTLAWTILVLLALSWGGTDYAWDSAAVLAPLIIGIVLLGAFIVVECKFVPLPVVPMYIFRNMTVAASMATSFCNGVAFYATLYYLPQYFQVVRGETPIQSGVDMLPLTFIQVFFSFLSGYIVSRTGDYKWNLMAGFFIWTIGLGLMSSVSATTSKPHIYGYQVLIGVGAGNTFQTSLLAIQASVARKDMATATGCRNFLRMLGGTVSLAACSAILNNIARTRIDNMGLSAALVEQILSSPTELAHLNLTTEQMVAIRDAYAKGINGCFYLCIPMTGISFFITVFFVKRVTLNRGDEEQLKAEAKAWVEDRKHKKGGSDGHSAPISEHTVVGADEKEKKKERIESSAEESPKHGHEHEVRDDLEAAAKGMDQAAGVALEKPGRAGTSA